MDANSLFTFFRDNKGLPFRSMTVFNYLLEAAVFGAVVIVLLLLVRKLFRKPLGNRVIYAAWLLVAIRLLVPLSLPNPLMNDLRPTMSTDLAARPVADQLRVRAEDALTDIPSEIKLAQGTSVVGDEHYDLVNAIFDIGVYATYGWVGKWVLIAYLAVDGGLVVWMALRNSAFRRKMKKQRVGELNAEQKASYLDLCHELRVKPLPVWLVDPLPGACLVGVFRPYIALPLTMKPEDVPLALRHELCHRKVHDEWWNVLRNLCCVVQWFNPLVWIGAKACRLDCEMACDDRVTRGMDEGFRKDYAALLLSSALKRNTPGITVLATGMTMTGKRLKQRITAIMQHRAVRRWVTAVFAVLASAVLVCAFATGEARPTGLSLEWEKAILGMALDNPFPLFTEMTGDSWAVERLPIATEADAIAQAKRYLGKEFLGGSAIRQGNLLYTVSHGSKGWYVCVTASAGTDNIQLLLSDDGTLLDFERGLLEGFSVNINGRRLPDNMEEVVTDAMTTFAVEMLGKTKVTNCHITAQRYNLTTRYLTATAEIDGRTCTMEIDMNRGLHHFRTAGASFDILDSPAHGLFIAYEYLLDIVKLSENVVSGSGVRYIPCPDEATGEWNCHVVLNRTMLGSDNMEALQRLTSTFGNRDTWYLLVDRNDHATAVEAETVNIPADAETQVRGGDIGALTTAENYASYMSSSNFADDKPAWWFRFMMKDDNSNAWEGIVRDDNGAVVDFACPGEGNG